MFWLSQNRFCNLCIKRNIQINLILLLHFVRRNTCKPYTVNWTKIILFLTIFTGNLGKRVIWKLSSQRPVSESINPVFCFHACSLLCTTLPFPILQQFGPVSRELEGKKNNRCKTALKSNNATLNPKGQLLPHTWHSLQYLYCSEVHSWVGTLPPRPHGVILIHSIWQIQDKTAYFGLLGSWGYLMILANEISSCFLVP